jgi:hypothetical protein
MLPQVAVALTLAGCSPYATVHPSWTSGEDNIAYAAAAICAPYVFDGVDASKLLTGQKLVRDDGWRPHHEMTSQGTDAGPVRVGYAGSVHVVMSETGGGRQCEITAHPLFAPASMTLADAQAAKMTTINAEAARTAAVDAQALRTAALKALARRPEGFTPTKSHYLPGGFASEDMLCSSPGSAHPGGFVVLSAAGPDGEGAVLLTIADAPSRMPSCDQEGVPMNFRTLASDTEK